MSCTDTAQQPHRAKRLAVTLGLPRRLSSRAALALALALGLSACAGGPDTASRGHSAPSAPAEVARMVDSYADRYDVPRSLVHRVVQRESGYNPGARNGPYYGLMQIHPTTATTMGFRGEPNQLLDAETNLNFAVKYLRGAWLVSKGSEEAAVGWYSRGYYYEAKKMGLLQEAGLR